MKVEKDFFAGSNSPRYQQMLAKMRFE